MVDWKRLGLAVLCAAILIGGCIALVHLPIYVFLALVVVILVFSFYKALGEVSDKGNE
jgi:hypothetical protein